LTRKKKRALPLQNVLIESYAAEGKSIAKLEDGKVLFVDNAIPGDVIDAVIIKDKKSWAQGRTTRLVKPSPQRITPFCQHFGVCGLVCAFATLGSFPTDAGFLQGNFK